MMRNGGINSDIDIVLPWVDESDPIWRAEKNIYFQEEHPEAKSNSDIRFQSWDNLKYLFRGIDKFMPWVHRIFFMTYGHLPDFLNTECPSIKIIKHTDYIPEEYLPTYNSNTIEMNCYRIQELSENFILFNDDCFPLQPVSKDYYFRNGEVCDEAVENIITTAAFGPVANMARYTQVNNMMIINKYFHKREVQAKHPEKWFFEGYGERLERTKSLTYWNDFPGFYDPHLPNALKKSTFIKLWELEPEALDIASRNRFRAYSDVTQYLARYWQLCEGNFYPRKSQGKVYFIDEENCNDIAEVIRMQKQQMICINENCTGDSFECVKNVINNAFEQILPEKSKFEK